MDMISCCCECKEIQSKIQAMLVPATYSLAQHPEIIQQKCTLQRRPQIHSDHSRLHIQLLDLLSLIPDFPTLQSHIEFEAELSMFGK